MQEVKYFPRVPVSPVSLFSGSMFNSTGNFSFLPPALRLLRGSAQLCGFTLGFLIMAPWPRKTDRTGHLACARKTRSKFQLDYTVVLDRPVVLLHLPSSKDKDLKEEKKRKTIIYYRLKFANYLSVLAFVFFRLPRTQIKTGLVILLPTEQIVYLTRAFTSFPNCNKQKKSNNLKDKKSDMHLRSQSRQDYLIYWSERHHYIDNDSVLVFTS